MELNKDTYTDFVNALYWYCDDNTNGKSDDLREIQLMLDYSPSQGEDAVSEQGYAEYIYDCLEEGVMDATELIEALLEYSST
jgi:hypothetical protein